MRIGVSVGRERVVGVAIADDGSNVEHEEETRPDRIADGYDALLRELIARTPDCAAPSVSSIAFDLSAALEPRSEQPATLIRIAPRPPVDAGHELRRLGSVGPAPRILHIAGGCTTLGEELVPLEERALRRAATALPRGGRYVVTGVGSVVNSEQEERVGEILLDAADPSSIDYSHLFPNSSFATRERTALTNSDLSPAAASLATSLTVISGELAPQARLYATTNGGGCVPLASIPLVPVHSLLSAAPTELIGAAALCGVDDGRLVVADSRGALFGEISAGVPTVVPQHRDASGRPLATQSANVLPVTTSLLAGRRDPPLLVVREGAEPIPGLGPHLRAEHDLRALGAAVAPLADWANRVLPVSNADEMQQALVTVRARVGARLVSFGAPPSQVRILEARVLATAYEHPNVVSVRVRGIAARHDAGHREEGARAA